MASNRAQHQEDAKLRIMRLINENPELSSRQIAERVGVSNGSAYYILSALIEKGLVKLGNFKENPKKKQYVYLLTRMGIKEKSILTYSFIKRKRNEFENLRKEIDILENELKINLDTDYVSNK